jgi:hypothetical protein
LDNLYIREENSGGDVNFGWITKYISIKKYSMSDKIFVERKSFERKYKFISKFEQNNDIFI